MSNQAPVLCAFGVRGTGKTTLAKSLISAQPRILAHDPFGEHAAVCVESTGQAAAYLDTLRKDGKEPTKYSVAITGFLEEEERERFCALAWILGRRAPLMVVLEEADQIAPPMREPRWLKRIIAQGRHVGISIMAVSRRPAEVSRLLTSQADAMYCFRTHEPRDVQYLRSIMGPAADKVLTLRGHQFIEWKPMTGDSGTEDDDSAEVDTEEREA